MEIQHCIKDGKLCETVTRCSFWGEFRQHDGYRFSNLMPDPPERNTAIILVKIHLRHKIRLQFLTNTFLKNKHSFSLFCRKAKSLQDKKNKEFILKLFFGGRKTSIGIFGG